MVSRQKRGVPPEPPMAGPRCLRSSPWGSRDPEDKLGPRGAEKEGPAVAPAVREGTPLPGRGAPRSRTPPLPGEAPEAVSAAATRTDPVTAAEDARPKEARRSRGRRRSRPGWALAAPAGCRGSRPVPQGQRRPGNNRPGSDVPRGRVQKEAGLRLRAGPGKGRDRRVAEEGAGGGRASTEAAEFHFGD